MAELTVPETLELLDRHGVPDPAYHVWADRYGLPPKSVADGVELLALGEPAGWELRSWRDGKTLWQRVYPDEASACAALLAALLGAAVEAATRPDVDAYRALRSLWLRRPWRRVPSGRTELLALLEEYGVPRSAYSLVGGRAEGRRCLEERTSDWRVFTVLDGARCAETTHESESDAVAAFWRGMVDHVLPTIALQLPLIAAVDSDPRADPDTDDLTLPEALAILDRHNTIRPSGIRSKRYGIDIPDYETMLSEDPDGRWRTSYTERGNTDVVATYETEGNACASLAVWSGAGFGIASSMWWPTAHAETPYEQLLYVWRLHPWRQQPTNRSQLSYLLRDHGFPVDSYNLSGGRYEGMLTLEQRLADWRVYGVHNGQRTDQAGYPTEAAACAEYWRRAVDDVMPSLIH